MTHLFGECVSLQDISALANWDTSNVTNMDFMFIDCKELRDVTALSSWDTSKVTDMSCMFYGCDINVTNSGS